jgi:hypothetical protein
MKKFLFLFLLVCAIARAEEIALPDGRVLHHAKVAKFFAGEFVIEHDGGIAHVPWAKMAAEYQQRYPLDSEKSSAERETAELAKADALEKAAAEHKQIIEARLAAVPTPPPMATPKQAAISREPVIGLDESAVMDLWGQPRQRHVVKDGDHLREFWRYKAANLYFTDARLVRIER